MLKAPAFLFPTSAIIVDDDNLYAQLLIDRLTNCGPIKAYSNFDFLLKQKDKDYCFVEGSPDSTNYKNINSIIKKSIANKDNLLGDMISVMIFDLHMENMTGLELLYQIKSPFVYKILISNFIDSKFEEEIKHAQNAGIIDVVLDKGDRLKEELPKAIFAGQSKFFTLLSNQIFEKQETQNYLSDTIFSEHYLKMIDTFRPQFIWPEKDLAAFTFERQSPTHKKSIFITTTDEINTLLSGYNAGTALPKTVEQLKSGKFMLCHENPHNLDGCDWAYYLKPAKIVDGSTSNFLYQTIEESEC